MVTRPAAGRGIMVRGARQLSAKPLGGGEKIRRMSQSDYLLAMMIGGAIAFLLPLLAFAFRRIPGRTAWLAWRASAVTGGVCLGAVIALGAALSAVPDGLLGPFGKAALGSWAAVALLVLQPAVARRLASAQAHPAEAARFARISAWGASAALLPPVLVHFME